MAAAWPPPDVSTEERLAQQGLVAPPRPAWQLTRPDALSNITLDTMPVHSELDVEAPVGTDAPFVRIEHPAPHATRSLAHIHDRTGRWLGTMTCERLAHLRDRFTAARAGRAHVFQELQAGTFEEELVGLLLRRSAHTRTMKEDQMQRTYGGTHNELVAAVQAATGADTELFASPLDVHRNMPSYLSTHPRDQLFGAGMDAYSHRWVGACFAHPPEQPEELERAVRWALASAREADRHTPVLTVMLLPDNAAPTAVDAAPHARWLAYPEVVDLACFPPSVAPLLAANDWTGAPPRFGSRQCTGHRLVAIGNNIGRERILRRDFGELWADLHRRIQLPVSFGLPWPWQQTDGQGPPRYNEQAYNTAVIQRAERYEQARKELTEQYRRPRKHATAASDTSSLWRWPPDGQASTLPPVAQLQQLYGSQQHRPRYEWRLAFFTDGSVQATEEGALVGAAVWHSTLGAYKINTNGDGPDNTITRAELAAIFCTVAQRLPRTDEGVIFTDSQAAIHLLHRAVHKPHTLEGHLHKELLLKTAQILVERANDGVRTRILKVKAHSGVTGNEEADAAAKAAAGADETHDFVMPAHKPFGGQWQPAFFEPPPEGAEGPASLRAVSNLTSALRKAVHASTKTGTSKVGIYAAAAQQMYDGQEDDRALGKESNAFWRIARVVAGARRTLLKHRTGQFWTKKEAFQRGAPYPPGKHGQPIATNSRCPLCGEPDSGGHVLLRCTHPQMKAMHIHRHDSAVRMIHTALQRGSCHGNAYTVLDACKQEELEGLTADAKRLPRWLLPKNVAHDDTLCRMRPDILRILGLPGAPTTEEIQHAVSNKHRHTIQVVEVGYCSDTQWRAKVADKLQQHEQLMIALEQAGWQVDRTPHIIVIGARGAIYHSGREALLKLGLSKTQASNVLIDIHLHTVQAVYDLSLARRRLERGHRQVGVG